MTSRPVAGWNEPRLPAQIALKYCLTRLCAVRFKYLLLLLVLESPRFFAQDTTRPRKVFGDSLWCEVVVVDVFN
jgi:hypothetical protein